MARLLPLARFGVCATLSRWRGYYGTHVRALIWRLSFIKCFFSIFFPENAFQIGLRIPEEIAPRTDEGQQPPKRASANERAIKRGSRGQGPRRSFLRLSPEKAGLPPGVGRGTTSQVWACAGPNGTTCRGPSPARDRAGNHLAGLGLRWSKRDHLPGALPRPESGGEPRCRSGPALVLTEPP